MTPLALPRLVRHDPISWELRPSKSARELLPRTHAHSAADARPGFRRCASAKDSTGWVEHEQFLGQRHYARWKRCSQHVLPKLMSSFKDFDGEDEDSGPAAHKVGKFQEEEILGTTTVAQHDICSSTRCNRFFEPLNDTTGLPNRVFRKTPPPPIARGVSMSDVPKQEKEEEEVDKDACLAAHQGVKLDWLTIPSDAASTDFTSTSSSLDDSLPASDHFGRLTPTPNPTP